MSPIRSASLLAAMLSIPACLDENAGPCQDYVAYMCDCHGDTEDCGQLRATYDGADQNLQDECAIALDAQQAQDDAGNHVCSSGEDTGE